VPLLVDFDTGGLLQPGFTAQALRMQPTTSEVPQ
jgi:hypothetical protein